MDKKKEYAMAVAGAILALFKDEEDGGNPDYHYDIETINGTEFITAMIMGCSLVYSQLTGDMITNLEFTHLCNQLIVQDLISQAKDGTLAERQEDE